ncbi:MAG: DNA repair and recombination protein RadB [Candidatus Aenigmatarchaeota archaeon]|nr:DNA repair and recombination protein RadB [Candidatus Aenigmarchaeota archaeon]
MKLKICEPIDELLDGGVETGTITNFFGEPASGKTNISLCAAISCAKSDKYAIFIDTEGGFSSERLKQLTENAKEISRKIILFEPKTWKEQCYIINNLEKICKKYDVGIIIVDSIVALWRIEIGNENIKSHENISSQMKINTELASQLAYLSRISREKNIPVIITNQVYSDFETGKTELSSKNIVKWWSKNLIEILKSGRNKRIARIERARSLPENKAVEFEIKENGFKVLRKFWWDK